jgi:hypothetical protein
MVQINLDMKCLDSDTILPLSVGLFRSDRQIISVPLSSLYTTLKYRLDIQKTVIQTTSIDIYLETEGRDRGKYKFPVIGSA